MPQYAEIPGATSLSQLIALGDAQNEAMRSLERGPNSAAPTIRPNGLLWNRTDFPVLGEVIQRWNATGSSWILLLDANFPALSAGGTIAMQADIPAGGFGFQGLRAGFAEGHSVRWEQVVLLDEGTGALFGDLDAGGKRIMNLPAPEDGDDAARYSDAVAVGDGLAYFNEFCALSLANDDENFEPVGWVPRAVTLRVYGDVIRLSDSEDWGTIDLECSTRFRWNPNVGAGYEPPEWITVGTQVVGSQTIRVQIKFKHTGDPEDLGFWVRVLNAGNQYHSVEVLQCWAVHGRGM